MSDYKNLSAANIEFLLDPDAEWSLQGFGMFRRYLSKTERLHVWDSRFSVPGVSTIHDHPWDFESRVLAGTVVNRLYTVKEPTVGVRPTHNCQRIKCGVGGCLVGDAPVLADLSVRSQWAYTWGERYEEKAHEIHESFPSDGTVTLVTRTFKKDAEHANVFFPYGTEWVSAEPRSATSGEIKAAIQGVYETLKYNPKRTRGKS